MLYYFSHSQMWNLTNPHKTFSSGFIIHILQPSSPKSQELRKKVTRVPVEEDLAQSWLIEALNRDQAKSESDPWLFRWGTASPHFWLNNHGAVLKEIFMQFLKANCRQNLFCTSILVFFSLKYIMLHNYIAEPRLRLNKSTEKLINWWVNISVNSPGRKNRAGKRLE